MKPYSNKKKVELIAVEIEVYNKRDQKRDTAWITIEALEKILDSTYGRIP